MKSNTKKRLIAFMLCMVLVLSSTISAFADDLDTQAQDQTTTMADGLMNRWLHPWMTRLTSNNL